MKKLSRYFHRQMIARPLAMFSVCFLIGIYACTGEIIPCAVLIFAAVSIFFLYLFLRKKKTWCWFLPLIIAFCLGDARMIAETAQKQPVPPCFSSEFEGKVVSDPYYNEDKERIICALRLRRLNGEPIDATVRLYLRSNVMELSGIEYGQTLTLFGHVWPGETPTNPYEYNQQKALFADGFSGMAAAKLENVQIQAAPWSLGKWRISLLHHIDDRIKHLFPENAALANAFILGDRRDLNRTVRQKFNQIGVAHLICISGLHISVLAMAISKLLGKFLTRKSSFICTLGGILLYGGLIGFSPALIRATLMFGVFTYAPIRGRFSDTMTRFCAALLIVLVIDPFHIYDIGFLLSYSASLGILLLMDPIESLFYVDRLKHPKDKKKKRQWRRRRMICYFPEMMCTTICAQLASLPILIDAFGAQSLLSLPANLTIVPLAMFAYPLGLAGLSVSAICYPLGQCICWVSDQVFRLMMVVINAFAAIPNVMVHLPQYPQWLVVIHFVLILMASGLNRIPIEKRRLIPLGLAALVGVSMTLCWIQSLGFSAIFLDAGQADTAVIRTEGKIHVVDVGDPYSPIADYISASCLKVDSVFLSHPHYDHAGGLTSLIQKLEPKTIYIPKGWYEAEICRTVREGMDFAREKNIEIIELSAGDVLNLSENVKVEILSPEDETESVNDMSLLMNVTYRDVGLLFTGDLTSEGEPQHLPDVDILKVPHHGSGDACSANMLSETSPEISIISVGQNNYGHPSEETLRRLQASGCEIYRTDQLGAVTITIDRNGQIHTKTYLAPEEYQ